jgi:prepilin-type N-terminal cleavage/methylation domain-containing protein
MNVHSNIRTKPRSGFTLLEMLVSVTLVLLMMTLFTVILQIATESVKTQRKIAEDDQKVRALTGMFRADIAKRTMRRVQPFFPGESADNSPTGFGNRQGYFYLSTNNSNSGGDDMLQLTVDVNQTQANSDLTAFFGRAERLVDRVAGVAESLSINPNQPELDDGQLNLNSTVSSSAAEVCYFIRNGNLYRRVLLLREPLPLSGLDLSDQPTNSDDEDFLSGYDGSGTYDGQFTIDDGDTDDFLTHFDLSAFPLNLGDVSGDGLDDFSARVVGLSGLSNDNTTVAIAKPNFRFGFDAVSGRPREHLSVGGAFMGRFLHAETSAVNFNYPQQHSLEEGSTGRLLDNGTNANGNPMDPTVEFTINRYGVIDKLDGIVGAGTSGRGGSRAVEDLLLANVHEMRVEVWDDRLGAYVPMAHQSLAGGVEGDYHASRLLNSNAGPIGSIAVLDTWNPDIAAEPPFQAYTYYPPLDDGTTAHQGSTTLTIGPSPAGSMPTGEIRPYWEPGVGVPVTDMASYAINDIVFAPWTDLPTTDGVFSYDEMPSAAFQLAYLCVDSTGAGTGNSGAVGSIDFESHTTPGRVFTDNEVTWQVIDNRRPLRAIRITIRFLNQKSGDMRQLTLELSLLDET